MSAGTIASRGVSAAPDPDLCRIRDLIYQAAGIFHSECKFRLLADRCNRRMRELNVTTFGAYLDCLKRRGDGAHEMTELLNEITIGETCFFRNQPQLDALKSIVWPRIIAARGPNSPKTLRVWSAGCSTGEEPYTLAIALLEESYGTFRGWTFNIQATDLNERSLEHAAKGVYGEYALRNVSASLRQKYFVPAGEDLAVNAPVKKLVTFSRVNLLDDSRMASMKSMDLIFCANVLIYFDLNSKRSVIRHFFNNLLQHGYLFLGHSESLFGVSEQFKLVHFPSTTGYVKVWPQGSGE